jgi:hypothetical protein
LRSYRERNTKAVRLLIVLFKKLIVSFFSSSAGLISVIKGIEKRNEREIYKYYCSKTYILEHLFYFVWLISGLLA